MSTQNLRAHSARCTQCLHLGSHSFAGDVWTDFTQRYNMEKNIRSDICCWDEDLFLLFLFFFSFLLLLLLLSFSNPREKEKNVRGCTSGVSLCTLYLHACQVRATVGDQGLCCCTCVTYFEC